MDTIIDRAKHLHCIQVSISQSWNCIKLSLFGTKQNLHQRIVTKMSSCLVNTQKAGNQTARGFFWLYFFSYFPLKVAAGHVHSSQGPAS